MEKVTVRHSLPDRMFYDGSADATLRPGETKEMERTVVLESYLRNGTLVEVPKKQDAPKPVPAETAPTKKA